MFHTHLDATVAQGQEQRIRNAWVVGSNPISSSICEEFITYEAKYGLGKIVERYKKLFCK